MEEVKQLEEANGCGVTLTEDLSKFDGWNPTYKRNRLRIFEDITVSNSQHTWVAGSHPRFYKIE